MRNFLIFLLVMLLVSCVGSNDGSTVTQGSYEVTITQPSLNGAPLGASAIVAGDCGIANYPISITGDVTLYSVCQADKTWAAPIPSEGFSPGQTIAVNVQLTSPDGGTTSPVVTRTFVKSNVTCDSLDNLTKLFANIDEGPDGNTTPYIICSPSQLANIALYPDKKFKLGQDIDFNYASFEPIAIPFSGELDGDGFRLDNLVVNKASDTAVGIFKTIISGATVKNIKIKNAVVTGNERVGIITGDWRGIGLVDNVTVTGTVNAVQMAGGLIGLGNTDSQLTITNSKVDVDVAANDFAGGLISYVFSSNKAMLLNNNEVYATVSGNDYVGGVIGRLWDSNAQINNTKHKGDITALGRYVGGVVGESYHAVSMDGASHIGSISVIRNATNGDMNVGGLIGVTRANTTIANSHVVSNITMGGDYAGGLVGRFFGGSISNSYVRGTLTVNDDYYNAVTRFVGGLAGNLNNNTTITNSHNHSVISANAEYTGGLVGFAGGATTSIDDSYNTGNVKGRKNYIGGLVGQFAGASVSDSFNTGNIDIENPTPNSYSAGAIGYHNGAATFTNLYSTGNVTVLDGTADSVGGVFGYVKSGAISKIFSAGSITGGRSNIGGIAGYLRAPLDSAMSLATVEGSLNNVGGIAGIVYQNNISNAFFNGSVTGGGSVAGIAGWFIPSSTTISNSYTMGAVYKLAGAAGADSTFGPIGGNISAPDVSSSYYLSTVTLYDLGAAGSIASPNLYGTSKTSSELDSSINYAGFNFSGDWVMPNPAFTLPTQGSVYTKAVMSWMDTANYGHIVAQTFSDDPINEADPTLISNSSITTNYAATFGENLTNSIVSTSPVSNVTVGNLEVSIEYPATNSENIYEQMLVYGQCGVAGNAVQISGDFSLWTICQPNNRWAAIIDASSLGSGNHTLSVDLKNATLGSGSPVVSRTVVKLASGCNDPAALTGQFGNSHNGGDGVGTPYLICTRGQFNNIGLYPSLKYELGRNIDFTGSAHDPILAEFTGTLDGKGLALENIIISKSGTDDVGLFKTVQGATLKNIKIRNFDVNGTSRVGVFAGSWKGAGAIANVELEGNVNGITYVGGLIGVGNTNSALAFSNLISTVSVTANDFVGGTIGYINTNTGSFTATDITLHNQMTGNGQTGFVGGFIGNVEEPNLNITNITQSKNSISYGMAQGGLIGQMAGGSINNCSVNANVTNLKDGTDGYIAGVVGRTTGSVTINICNFNGIVHAGSDHVAGVVGYMHSGTISYATSSGVVEVDDQRYNVPRSYAAGIIARSVQDEDVHILNSSSSMTINAIANNVGGVAGKIHSNDSTMKNSFATGPIFGQTQFIGGLAGFFMGEDLHDSYSTGKVTVTNPTPAAYIGGLVGYANSWTSNYQRIYSTSDIEVTTGTADYVGGLVGYFRGGNLENSYATGNIYGSAVRNSAGGLIGLMRGNTTRSYATGDVTCTGDNCAGLIGYLLNANVTNSFATGDISSVDSAAGLVSFVNIVNGTNIIEDNYYAGTVTRASGTSTLFGQIVADDVNSAYDGTKNFYFTDNDQAYHNNSGIGITIANGSSVASYTTFDTADSELDWTDPAGSFEIETGVAYTYPILDWMESPGGGATSLFSISGTLSGLQHDQIKLRLNGSEQITLDTSDTNFAFTTQIADGGSYSVTIDAHPSAPSLTCNITNGSGTATADVTNVQVVCPTIDSIDLVAPSNSLNIGASQTLTVNATLSDTSTINISDYVSWSQSPSGIFSLSTSNVLTAIAAGSSTITATYGALSSNEAITSVAVGDRLAVTSTIANTTGGANLGTITVEVRDVNDQVVSGASNIVALSIGTDPSGNATLSGNLTATAVNGVATFTNVSLDKAANGYTIQANSSGLTAGVSNAFNISVGAKAKLQFTTNPPGAAANAPMTSFSVEITDIAGNRTTDSDTITIAIGNDPSNGVGSIGGTVSVAAVNGLATFNSISIDFASSGYTFNATASSLTTTESGSFNIYVAPSKLLVTKQPVHTDEGVILNSFKVSLMDDFNNVITTASDSVTISLDSDPTGGSANVLGTLTKNAVSGVVTFDDISIDQASYGFTIRAVAAGLTDAVTNAFNITLAAPSVVSLVDPVVSPGADSTPTINVAGLSSGDNVELFTNSSCTGQSVASYTSSGADLDMTTTVLTEGVYNFYAKRTSSSGTQSSCSLATVEYELENPFSQEDDLNSSFGNWINETDDDGDWSLNTGGTPSSGVGPTSGSYAYIEASSPVGVSDVFILESNTLDGSSNTLDFSFEWNKRGSNMGDLFLEASSDGGTSWSSVWSHTGVDIATNGTDVWRQNRVDLCDLGYTSSNTKLRFRAVMPASGSVWNSDIAIDNLSFSDGGCGSASAASATFDFPSEGTIISAINQTNFTVSGTCSDIGQNVILSGDTSGSTTCDASNNWSFSLDLSALGDGFVNISIIHVSGSGGANGTASRSFLKDALTLQYDAMETIGNWSNVAGDDRDWSINSGQTPSSGVGPSAGVNASSYIYTEASSPVSGGDVFILESNTLDGSVHNISFNFNWNKRGSNMGDLYLEASSDGGSTWSAVWSHIGSDILSGQADVWNNENIDLCNSGYNTANTKLRFRAVMPTGGSVWNSDIALDELRFNTNGCNTGTPAVISVVSPVEGAIVSQFNQGSFTVTGTCSDNGQNIMFSGDVSGSTTCNVDSWSYDFDLTSLPDGNLMIIADHISSDGGATGRDTITYYKDTISGIIYNDSFDSISSVWLNVTGDQRDWSYRGGDTPSSGVGPTSDNGGSGDYIYTEASSPVSAGDEFILESITLDGSSHNLLIDFMWNKRGDSMGNLYLEASSDGGTTWSSVWSHLGVDVARNGADVWNNNTIDLCNSGYNTSNTKLRFRAVMPTSGTIWHSDIALDDIKIKNTGCQ